MTTNSSLDTLHKMRRMCVDSLAITTCDYARVRVDCDLKATALSEPFVPITLITYRHTVWVDHLQCD
ncbi:MAG TPA: hypothetical protein VLH56_09860 [Dissulfurispiraceae bacterium]|nr:hypothetical protein [Dissulfurispiraceae bacterium]